MICQRASVLFASVMAFISCLLRRTEPPPPPRLYGIGPSKARPSVAEWGQLQQHHGKGVTIDLDARITLQRADTGTRNELLNRPRAEAPPNIGRLDRWR